MVPASPLWKGLATQRLDIMLCKVGLRVFALHCISICTMTTCKDVPQFKMRMLFINTACKGADPAFVASWGSLHIAISGTSSIAAQTCTATIRGSQTVL